MVRASGDSCPGYSLAESAKRGCHNGKHQAGRVRDRLSLTLACPTPDIHSIEDWRNDEVWIYLNQWQNPWGNSNKDLFTMYQVLQQITNALVIDTST